MVLDLGMDIYLHDAIRMIYAISFHLSSVFHGGIGDLHNTATEAYPLNPPPYFNKEPTQIKYHGPWEQ